MNLYGKEYERTYSVLEYGGLIFPGISDLVKLRGRTVFMLPLQLFSVAH